jgi:flagellar biogenesis protein FliO
MARHEDHAAAEERGGGFGRLVALAALVGVGAYVVTRLRERQLDEAIWEDPPNG